MPPTPTPTPTPIDRSVIEAACCRTLQAQPQLAAQLREEVGGIEDPTTMEPGKLGAGLDLATLMARLPAFISLIQAIIADVQKSGIFGTGAGSTG